MIEKVKAVLADEVKFDLIVTRLAHEIFDHHPDLEQIGIIGMRTRGEFLAKRIVDKLNRIGSKKLQCGVLDVTLYRDDFRMKGKMPKVEVTNIPFDVDGRDLILIDDVIFTGRTIRAALDALMDLGRPDSIRLAILVDRGHRELPIQPDYVGRVIPTSIGEEIRVRMKEVDGEDSILLVDVKEG